MKTTTGAGRILFKQSCFSLFLLPLPASELKKYPLKFLQLWIELKISDFKSDDRIRLEPTSFREPNVILSDLSIQMFYPRSVAENLQGINKHAFLVDFSLIRLLKTKPKEMKLMISVSSIHYSYLSSEIVLKYFKSLSRQAKFLYHPLNNCF